MQLIELGVSDKDVLERYNLVWIITDYEIEVVRLPRFAEEITIETEALSYNRLFCYRRFTLYERSRLRRGSSGTARRCRPGFASAHRG